MHTTPSWDEQANYFNDANIMKTIDKSELKVLTAEEVDRKTRYALNRKSKIYL